MPDFAGQSERERQELIDALAEGVESIKGWTDRIGNIWALTLMAENVSRLDDLDRRDGFLPIQVRPPLMINCREANLVLKAVKHTVVEGTAAGTDTVSLLKKLRYYLHLSE